MSGAGEAIHYDLSGIGVRLRNAPAGWPELMSRWWADFASPSAGEPFLDVEVAAELHPVWPGIALTAELVPGSAVDGSIRFRMPEGEVELHPGGRARIILARGTERSRCYAVMGLMLAALGSTLPTRGVVVLHAGGIVVDDRAFLMVGPAGAGKSTWVDLALEAGAQCLSDDVVFADASRGPVALLGVPFRADRPRPIGRGRWPLAAALLPAHGREARLDSLDPMQARGVLAANLLYLTPEQHVGPRVASIVDRIVDDVPLRTLTFSPEPSFVGLLREFPRKD